MPGKMARQKALSRKVRTLPAKKSTITVQNKERQHDDAEHPLYNAIKQNHAFILITAMAVKNRLRLARDKIDTAGITDGNGVEQFSGD
jgi:hypothetical protein